MADSEDGSQAPEEKAESSEPSGAEQSGAEPSGAEPADAEGQATAPQAVGKDGPTEPLGPVLADALGRVLAVARVQARSRFEDAAKRARRRLDFFQARRDLDRLYQKLGREVVQLVEAGEVTHPGLVRGVERIQQQESLVSEAAEQLGTTPEALAEE